MKVQKHFASFSEAIREGAKIRPQCFGVGFDDIGTCAYGAGVEAIAGSLAYELYQAVDVELMYPYLGSDSLCPACPVSDPRGDRFLGTVFHLNDVHRWTREAIAGWLESEEEKLGYVLLSEEVETVNVIVPSPPVAVAG